MLEQPENQPRSVAQPEETSSHPASRIVTTDGGDYAEGSIDKRQGIFYEVTEELSYSVNGLSNPYLGLRAFTDADKDIFAGREQIVRILVERLSADDNERLLMIVGASGSGKSSLVRAGLLPALAEHLKRQGHTCQTTTVDHPGRALVPTLARIAEALTASHVSQTSPIHLILIDQFEEVFSLPEATDRHAALSLLADLAKSSVSTLRIITTMRSEFLPMLVADPRFEQVERSKVVLRGMHQNELHEAIQRPIQVRHPQKRIEPALLSQLVQDSATDASYLPLLQVTLEDLWRGGSMRLGAYNELGGLVGAIQRRADAVYNYRDHGELQQEPRSVEEQAAILNLFIDLVRVSLSDEQRDVRWQRARSELVRGDEQRERLVDDLVTARLLRTDREVVRENGRERTIEIVDIVHEALLRDWSRLSDAINTQREALRQRERFLLALHEWQTTSEREDYLLSGVRLAEAEALYQRGDRVVHEANGQRFFTTSIQRRDVERQRKVGRARMVAAGLGTLALLAFVAAGIAIWFGSLAQERAIEANTAAATARASEATAVASDARAQQALMSNFVQRLAAQADSQRQVQPDLALLLAVEAHKRAVETPEIRDVLMSTLYGVIAANGSLQTMLRGDGTDVRALAFSTDAQQVISGDNIGRLYFWDVANRSQIAKTDPSSCRCGVVDIKVSHDGNTFAVAGGNTVEVYDAKTRSQVKERTLNLDQNVRSIAYHPDDASLLAVATNNRLYLWRTTEAPAYLELDARTGDEKNVRKILFSPDGDRFFSAGEDGYIRIWDTTTGDLLQELSQVEGSSSVTILALAISSNSQYLASSDWNRIVLWQRDAQTGLYVRDGSPMIAHDSWVNDLAFAPDSSRRLVSVSTDQSVVLWLVAERKPEEIYYAHKGEIKRIVFSQDSVLMATGGADGQIAIWTALTSGQLASRIDQGGIGGRMDGMAITSTGAVRALVVDDASLFVRTPEVPLETQRSSLQAVEHSAPPKAAAFNSDGTLLSAGYADGTVLVWRQDGTSLGSALSISTPTDNTVPEVSELVFSHDGQLLAAGGNDGRIVVWNLAQLDSAPVRLPYGEDQGHTRSIISLAFSPDNQLLASGSWVDGSRALLWDIESQQRRYALLENGEQILSLAFRPDGRTLVGGGDQSIYVWDVESGQQRTQPMVRHRNDVNTLAFSPNGHLLASGGQDGLVILWNMETFQQFGHPLRAATLDGSVRHIRFATDEQLIVAHASSSLWLVNLNPQHWLEAACHAANRPLTQEEWTQYIGSGDATDTCSGIIR